MNLRNLLIEIRSHVYGLRHVIENECYLMDSYSDIEEYQGITELILKKEQKLKLQDILEQLMLFKAEYEMHLNEDNYNYNDNYEMNEEIKKQLYLMEGILIKYRIYTIDKDELLKIF